MIKLLLILLVGGALANSLAQPSQPPLLIDNGSGPAALDAAD